MVEFSAELRRVTSPTPPTPAERQEDLLERVRERSDVAAAEELVDVALTHPDDSGLHLDVMPYVRGNPLRELIRRRPDDLLQVVEQMLTHQQSNWDYRQEDVPVVVGLG